MEVTPTPAVATTPAPAVPVPAPAPVAAPATPVLNVVDMGSPMPQMQDGGMTSGSQPFFKNINLIELGFGILGAVSLYYIIYYYRFKLKQDKLINNELQRQIDELKMNLQSNLKGKYKSL